MSSAVADTSALVSLGVVTDSGSDTDPLSIFLTSYDVTVPSKVVEELDTIASYDDDHGQAATAVFERRNALSIRSVGLDATFPLDDGENAAVTLANESAASIFLCDEFNQLGLIHASLADTRLVTTPTLLSIFVRTGKLSSREALVLLDEISAARSWVDNSYVRRARSLLEDR